MRLFVAVHLFEAHQAWLRARQHQLQQELNDPSLRWTPPEQWHITLRFLGECSDAQAARLLPAMKQTARDTTAFPLTLGKVGAFSGPRMGTLWVGVEEGQEALTVLVSRLNRDLEAAGFPTETRLFRAHVTLARNRSKIPGKRLLDLPPPKPCPEALITQMHLYQSTITPTGAEYTRLHTANFRSV